MQISRRGAYGSILVIESRTRLIEGQVYTRAMFWRMVYSALIGSLIGVAFQVLGNTNTLDSFLLALVSTCAALALISALKTKEGLHWGADNDHRGSDNT
jgi:hypothetical protein